MFTRHRLIALAVVAALGAPAAVGAQDIRFSYIEGGIVGGFVNDIEGAGTFTGTGTPLQLEADAGGGGFVSGAWQLGGNLHLFADYSLAGQELEVRGGPTLVEGEFDIVSWRLGVGYAHALSSRTSLYGRLSLDSAELKDLRIAGLDFGLDGAEEGIGTEVGVVWAATPSVHLQGHARYTSVGEIADEGSDVFDADFLVGVAGRWYFRPNIAAFTSYELGKITTWRLGLRYDF
ncbi:MAG: hypothetical protein MEQ07_10795 [Aquimonas sp.]|nr:hypothetical protein [Aquimonas sp.]